MSLKSRMNKIEKNLLVIRADPQTKAADHYRKIGVDLWESGKYEAMKEHWKDSPELIERFMGYKDVIEKVVKENRNIDY